MNTLTVIEFKDKKPGDILIRKEDNLLVGYVKENGGLDLHTDDMDLHIICARPENPFTEYANRIWTTNTGLTVTETSLKVSTYTEKSNGRLKKV